MAEIILRNNKGKKIMPRVDLTPMVDLGFLLITFFIVTTSMSKPNAMSVNLTANGEGTKWGENKTLTLILKENNMITYYNGNDSLNTNQCSYNNDLRNIIYQKQLAVEKHFGNKKDLLVLIKPTTNCSYKNIVDALDEMKINNVKMYTLINK